MGRQMDLDALQCEYNKIRDEAERVAGDLDDIPLRAMILHNLYIDSNQNYPFPLIAAHGALWAFGYFEVGGSLGRFIANRYFYDRKERAYRQGLLNEFATAFRRVNRLVCIDTFTNYNFTKRFGHEPGAELLVKPVLLETLNRVHAARLAGIALTEEDKAELFTNTFEIEQEFTVAPGVKQAVDNFECRILKYICMHPWVRFAYFPRGKMIRFHDFSDRSERVKNGLVAYRYAVNVGWDAVASSLKDYSVLPNDYFAAPEQYLRKSLNAAASRA